MEPIPLRQVLLTERDDFNLLDTASERVAGVLSEQELLVPRGQVITCPPLEEGTPFTTEGYILQCKQLFDCVREKKQGFLYLCGAPDFRALRAAVLALSDMCDRTVIAEMAVGTEGFLDDGTDCVAAVGVLQRIGVSTVILHAGCAEELTEACARIAPYARISMGVCVPCEWLYAGIELVNVELFLPFPGESAKDLANALDRWDGQRHIMRDHDDVILAPDGRNAHFIDLTIDFSEEIPCDHRFSEHLLEAEDEQAAAFKLVLEDEESVLRLEEFGYMISRPVCLCAADPELLEAGLRVFPGLTVYDGTWELEEETLKYFARKYGMIKL